MERGKEMQSYIDRGQGAHRRSLGGQRRGPRDRPWRRTRPGHLPGAAGRGPPDPREMPSFIGALCWLAFVCCPPTPGSPSLPSTPTRPRAPPIVPADSLPLDTPGLSWTLGFSGGRPYRSGQHRLGGRGQAGRGPECPWATPQVRASVCKLGVITAPLGVALPPTSIH